MSHPCSRFKEAIQQVKHDVERMKAELNAGLERVLDFRDKAPRRMRDNKIKELVEDPGSNRI